MKFIRTYERRRTDGPSNLKGSHKCIKIVIRKRRSAYIHYYDIHILTKEWYGMLTIKDNIKKKLGEGVQRNEIHNSCVEVIEACSRMRRIIIKKNLFAFAMMK